MCTLTGFSGDPTGSPSSDEAFDRWWSSSDRGAGWVAYLTAGSSQQRAEGLTPERDQYRKRSDDGSEADYQWEVLPGRSVQVDLHRATDGWHVTGVNACTSQDA